MSHYVVRTYSGPTAKNTLWKVLSRPIADYHEAEIWMEHMKDVENKPHSEYFIVTKREK